MIYTDSPQTLKSNSPIKTKSHLSHSPHKKKPKIKKKQSKLSLAVEKNLSLDLEINETKHTSSSSSDESNESPFSMIYITTNLMIGNSVKTISFPIDSKVQINEVIPKAISGFNTLFKEDKALFEIKTDPSLYALKQPKKNGLPNIDMPNINVKISLAQSQFTQFSLVWKAEPGDFDSYFKRIEVEIPQPIKKHCNKNCLIF